MPVVAGTALSRVGAVLSVGWPVPLTMRRLSVMRVLVWPRRMITGLRRRRIGATLEVFLAFAPMAAMIAAAGVHTPLEYRRRVAVACEPSPEPGVR